MCTAIEIAQPCEAPCPSKFQTSWTMDMFANCQNLKFEMLDFGRVPAVRLFKILNKGENLEQTKQKFLF